MQMDDIHGIEHASSPARIAQADEIPSIHDWQARRADDIRLIILVVYITKGEDIHMVTLLFKVLLVQGNIVGDAADMGFIGVHHHPDAHIILTLCNAKRKLANRQAKMKFGKIKAMQNPAHGSNLPDIDRLSVLGATIMLAYLLARFIDLPARTLALQLPGFYIFLELSVNTLVGLLVAGLTITGTGWLLHDHPALGEKSTIEHWLLPALTAVVIGIPLAQLSLGVLWWVGFLTGGVILLLTFVAEYIVVDVDDVRQPLAAVGLTALSFALFLALAVALRFGNWRLFGILPSLGLAAFLVSLRTLHLRLGRRWAFFEAGLVAWITVQVIAAAHYLPLSAGAYGLLVLGSAYALTSLAGNLAEGQSLRNSFAEPLAVLVIIWGIAWWLG